ncbi:uncharacterized protein LOC111339593 [Stylophora pistillata]|uniref:uncharacterized protein LOC111339593 n=1 Tax=Stylophora pistillata TaxID=50429 RepID=UPI000C039BA8|nr:uncharacterized protein LOC111339593 [Stylophora pistillata]
MHASGHPVVYNDRMCFLSMALSAFLSTFRIPELKKGFFPHKFHMPDHQNYVGPLPAAEYYDPEGLSQNKKQEFETWYAQEQRKNQPFHLKEELIAYCCSDVKLLKAGCQKFIEEFQSIAKFNPMAKCVTIAQACNRYWRKCVMTPESITIEPECGREGATPNHSHVALEWLLWTERNLGTRLQHARNDGEYSIPHDPTVYSVDGYDAQTRTVYEFHGCLFHWCRECYPQRSQIPFCSSGLTVEACRRQTAQKTTKLRQLGYAVVDMWQCQWEQLKKIKPDLRDFVQSLSLTTPIHPREAFFGGRTETTTLYHRIDPTQREQIRYVDVTSE